MGQSQASASVWRYNDRMATEGRCQVSRTPRALAVPTYGGTALTPEELAEFIDSLEYDEAPAAATDCANCDPE
jgi:hypothetical protein